MKKYLKLILSVLILCFTVLTVTSCDAARNTKKPTGSLDLSSNYASLDSTGEKVTYGEMYNLFRNTGYNTVLNNIKKQLFQKEMSKISYATHKDDYDEYILNAIYGVSEVDDFLDLEEDSIKTSAQKFIDSQLSSTGIDYSAIYKSNPETFIPSVSADNEFVLNWPLELIDQYTYVIAILEYTKTYIESITDMETIIDVDGDEIENTYYIDDETLESAYAARKDYTSYADALGITYPGQANDELYANHAVVVKYASAAQAEKYLAKTTTKLGYDLTKENITDEEIKEYYIDLYNTFNKDKKEPVSISNLYSNESTTFFINQDENQFAELGTTVTTFLSDNLVDLGEDGTSYLQTPFNLSGDNNYYMVLRLNVYEGEEFDKLTDSQRTVIDPLSKEALIEGWASETYANTLVENRMKSSGFSLRIYDPVYENQYANSFDDYYDFGKSFDNNLVYSFTYTYPSDAIEFANVSLSGSSCEYTVDDSFDDLNKIYGVSKAVELLSTKYLLNSTVIMDEIDTDLIDGFEDGLKDAIKTFRRNETNYSKKMGVSNYLVLTYGFESQEDIVNYRLLSSTLSSLFSSYYGSFNGDTIAETNQVAGGKIAFKDNGLIANLQTFTNQIYNNYYSLDVAHMLIALDTDLDGTNEDPEEFMENLSDENLALFKTDLLTLADAIVREAEVITADRIQALSYLATSFNNQGYHYVLQNEKYAGKTWADFTQNFEFKLTSEDLSTINNSNGSSYVESFTNEAIALYDTLTKDEYETIKTNIEDDGYWKYNDTVANTFGVDINGSIDEQLTATTYGWHMLYVYDMTDQTSCKFTESNDSTLSGITKDEGDPEEKYGTWEYQDIVVYQHDTDTTDDDEVVYASGYSDLDTPSLEQLFIYFIEYLNNGSVSSMRSSTVTAVSGYFSSVISRYTSSNFVTYRLNTQIGNITFDTNGFGDRYELSKEILIRTIDNYEEVEEGDDFYGWFDKDWTVKGLR